MPASGHAEARTTPHLLVGKGRDRAVALAAVEDFFRTLASRLRSRLVSRCSDNFEVRLAGVDERTLADVLEDDALRSGSIFQLVRFDVPKLPGVAVMQRALLSRIIGAMLGDEEGAEDDGSDARPLTPVETRIARRVLEDLITEIEPAWPGLPAPPVIMDGPAGGPRVIPRSARSTEVYAATLDFGPPEAPLGLLSISVPTQAFRDLSGPAAEPDHQSLQHPIQPHFERVLPLKVELVAEMARLRMDLSAIRRLTEGDVLTLGALKPTTVRINGKPVLEAEAGHAGGHRSLRITRRL